MLGTVERIQIKTSKPQNSYGFISSMDGESYYFPLAGREDLKTGMKVSFRGDSNDKGKFAHDIQTII